MTKSIIYPSVSCQNFTIGVTAPSSGLGESNFIQRANLVKQRLEKGGHKVIFGNCLMENKKHVSGPKKLRSQELQEFWHHEEIDVIHPPWGGENLIDLLSLIDFEALQLRPTWVQGFSDMSTLLFAITVKTGIATAHGTNFIDFVEGQDHLTNQCYEYLRLKLGESFTQCSSPLWQTSWPSYSDNVAVTFNLTEPTYWQHNGDKPIKVKGRLIGGCLDTVRNLVGTIYGDIPQFVETYAQEDGLLIYLENCESKPTEVYRALWNMKLAGWFDHARAIIFGRNAGPEANNPEDMSYLEAVFECLGDLGIPIIWDADIGHVPPQMMLINGALAELTVDDGKATLLQQFI